MLHGVFYEANAKHSNSVREKDDKNDSRLVITSHPFVLLANDAACLLLLLLARMGVLVMSVGTWKWERQRSILFSREE